MKELFKDKKTKRTPSRKKGKGRKFTKCKKETNFYPYLGIMFEI